MGEMAEADPDSNPNAVFMFDDRRSGTDLHIMRGRQPLQISRMKHTIPEIQHCTFDTGDFALVEPTSHIEWISSVK
jgi:hypothetical protein